MDIGKKIKLAEAYAGTNDSELARRLNTSSQALGQRIKTGRFTSEDLDRIAEALGAEYVCYFKFPDGEKI